MSTDTAPTQSPRPRGTDAGVAAGDPPVIDLRMDGTAALVDSRTQAPVVAPSAPAAAARPAAQVVVGWIVPPAPPRPAPPRARWLAGLALAVSTPLAWPALVLALPLGEAAQGGVLVGGWTLMAVIAGRIAAHDERTRG